MATKPLAESLERIYRYLTTGSTALGTTSLTRTGVVKAASDIAENAVLAASTTKPGLVELAIGSEVTTGTDATRAVTPKALADAGVATVAAASETVAGKVELATTAEAITGTDTARAVTPAGLAAYAPAASTTTAGKVELATQAEGQAVTDQARAVTPYALGKALASLDILSFTGAAAAGACTLTGAKVGDVVFGLAGLTDMGGATSKFEAIITVDDQIQQTDNGNLSAKNYVVVLYRPVDPA